MAELISNENAVAVFTVEIDNKDFNAAINNVYKETKNQFRIEGFRKGKAPRKIIEMNYGKEIFFEDALNDILNEVYGESLKELDLDPIDYPEIDLKDGPSLEAPFAIEFKVKLMPVPVLKEGYQDAKIDLVQMDIEDADVDHVIQQEQEKNARLVEVEDRPAEEGDTVNIDYEGLLDGEAFEGGTGEGYSLELGSGTFIDGFEEGLVGAESGQELDLELTFPESYTEELAGKDVVFKVRVNNIKTKELPELDDDFAMDVSEFDTFQEYRDDVAQNLEEQMENENKNERYNKAMEALVEYLDVDLPEVLIDRQVEIELNSFGQRVSQMGISLDSYYHMTNTDEETVKTELRPQAIARLQSDFVVQAIADLEDFQASEEEVDEELRKMAENYQVEDVDGFVKDYKESGSLDQVEDLIIQTKALDKAVEIVDFNMVDSYESGVLDLEEDQDDQEEDQAEEANQVEDE